MIKNDNKIILYNDLEQEFDPEKLQELKDLIYYNYKNYTFLVIADLGLWYGRHKAFKILDTLSNKISMFFEDYNEVYTQDGVLMLDAHHHDGVNHLTFKLLNKQGIEYYNRCRTNNKIFNIDTLEKYSSNMNIEKYL